MSQDTDIRERIDVRWAVRTRSRLDTPHGEAWANGSFMITLGTYDGDISKATMADNISSRGVHQGDILTVSSAGDAVSIDVATANIRDRGILEEDIVEMIVQAVLLDELEIATSMIADQN